MATEIENYALQLAEKQVGGAVSGMESREAQVQRLQAEIVEDLEKKKALCEQGYELFMEEVQLLERNGELGVPGDADDESEPASEKDDGSQKSSQRQGPDDFIEPGKIVFRLHNPIGFLAQSDKTYIIQSIQNEDLLLSYSLLDNAHEGIYEAHVFWYNETAAG